VKARLGGSKRDSKYGGHVQERQPQVVPQDEHGSEVGAQPAETSLELLAIRDDGLDAADRCCIQRFELDVHPMPAEAPRFVDTGPHEEPVKPRVEALRISQRRQVAPRADERVLHGVLGLVDVAEDQPGRTIETRDRAGSERRECVVIAVTGSFHEVSLHHASSGGAARWSRLPSMARRPRGFVPEMSAGCLGVGYDRRPVKIQEADAKKLLLAQGLPVPPWEVARSPAEARAAAHRLLHAGGQVVIKAQVLVGGRGKAGGVKLAASDDEAEHVADDILGMSIKGITVRKVLVAPAADIVSEYYLAAVLDRAARRILLMGSAEGGVEIEQVAASNPGAIVRIHVDPLLGLRDWQARELAFQMGLGTHLKAAVGIAKGLVRTMLANDADLVEINPLAIVREGSEERLACLDAKITLDDSALFRHPDHEALRDPDEEEPADAEARRHDISFIHLDGTIGCMVNGAGLAMTTMDLVKRAGGEPANFLDIGGGAKAERVAAAMRLILAEPKVEAILVNIFGGITRGDEVALGLIEARKQQTRDVPMVVRIVGTNAAEAARLLEEAHFETAASLDEAAAKAVAASRA